MKAAFYEAFEKPLKIEDVADPTPPPDGVVLKVLANGICRSDWHGWKGHDPDIQRLESQLSDKIGVPVLVQHNANGKGRLVLKYHSLDELEGILRHIR